MSVPDTGPRPLPHAATTFIGQSGHDKHDCQVNIEKQSLRHEVDNKLHSKFQHGLNLISINQSSYGTDNQQSQSLMLPTPTHYSQTPLTLSPATPFFDSYNSQNEGLNRNNSFEGKSECTDTKKRILACKLLPHILSYCNN